jgi:hypothetical protein
VPVPFALREISVNTICPHCKTPIRYSARLAGEPVVCPVCQKEFTMPEPDQQARLLAEDETLRREQQARFARSRARPPHVQELAQRYPALRFLAGLHQFLALAVLFGSLVGLATLWILELPMETRVQGTVFLAVVAPAAPAVLWGIGELILLFVDMANDARIARIEVERLRRKRRSL